MNKDNSVSDTTQPQPENVEQLGLSPFSSPRMPQRTVSEFRAGIMKILCERMAYDGPIFSAAESESQRDTAIAEILDRMKPTKPVTCLLPLPFTEKSLAEMGLSYESVIGQRVVPAQPKPKFHDIIRRAIVAHKDPDVYVRIGNDGPTFHCFRVALNFYSEYFIDHLDKRVIHLPADKITSEMFDKLYKWMLANVSEFEVQDICALYEAGSFLDVKPLIQHLRQHIDTLASGSREDITLLMHLQARTFGNRTLADSLVNRMPRMFLSLVASSEFVQFKVDEVCWYLNKGTMAVFTETEIFMSAIRWVNYDWPSRKALASQVMKCVRYNYMPIPFLSTLNDFNCTLEFQRVVIIPEIKAMISDGIKNNMNRKKTESDGDSSADGTDADADADALFNPSYPPRIWAYDKHCRHHHHYFCPRVVDLTYESFLDYLRHIQNNGPNYWKNLQCIADSEKLKWTCCAAYRAMKSIKSRRIADESDYTDLDSDSSAIVA